MSAKFITCKFRPFFPTYQDLKTGDVIYSEDENKYHVVEYRNMPYSNIIHLCKIDSDLGIFYIPSEIHMSIKEKYKNDPELNMFYADFMVEKNIIKIDQIIK